MILKYFLTTYQIKYTHYRLKQQCGNNKKDGPSSLIQMKYQITYQALTVPYRDSSDQDRSGLCLHTMYNYEMLSAITGKDVVNIERAEDSVLEEQECLSWGNEEAYKQNKVFSGVSEFEHQQHRPTVDQNGLQEIEGQTIPWYASLINFNSVMRNNFMF